MSVFKPPCSFNRWENDSCTQRRFERCVLCNITNTKLNVGCADPVRAVVEFNSPVVLVRRYGHSTSYFERIGNLSTAVYCKDIKLNGSVVCIIASIHNSEQVTVLIAEYSRSRNRVDGEQQIAVCLSIVGKHDRSSTFIAVVNRDTGGVVHRQVALNG